MPIISAFCKKGGVGKTTFLGYLAHYHATQGKTVLVISADDQNSIFKIFGVDHFVTDRDDDFFEHLLVGEKEPQDITFEARINMYLMKTLNTDRLSLNLTLKRSEEKHLFYQIFRLYFYRFSAFKQQIERNFARHQSINFNCCRFRHAWFTRFFEHNSIFCRY